MYSLRRWSGKRGASVLAALVLVAILGAALLVFQYIRSAGDFAYESESLVAATTVTTSGGSAPLPTGCTKTDAGTVCQCNQKTITPSISGSATQESIKGCLPGCIYDVSPSIAPDRPAVISVDSSSPANSNPITNMPTACSYRICTGPNAISCGAVSASAAGSSVSLGALSTAAAATPVGTDSGAGGQAPPPQIPLQTAPDSGAPPVTADTPPVQTPGYALPGSAAPASGGTAPDTTGTSPTPTDQTPPTPTNPQQPTPAPVSSDVTTLAPPVDCTGMTTEQCQKSGGNPNPQGLTPSQSQNLGAPSTFPCPIGYSGNMATGCTQLTTAHSDIGAPLGGGATDERLQPMSSNTANNTNTSFSLPSGATAFLTGLIQGVARGLASSGSGSGSSSAAPYGVGSDGTACPAPQAQPAASSCTVGTWQQMYQTNNCPTTWQCMPSSSAANQPTAAISCQPQTADVGMNISLSYSCGNATGSSGSGFSTNNQLSGSTTTVMTAPPAGSTATSYTLTCTNQSSAQSQTASAQCGVQVNQPSIVLVANPNPVASGAAAAVGWVTSGMSACTVSSPTSPSFTAANAGNTSVNGVANTPPLTSPMTVVLNCQTTAGGTKSASVQVGVGSGNGTIATSTPVSVSSSVDGGSVTHGSAVTITWSSVSPPAGSVMSLWLLNEQTNKADALIAGDESVNGVYTWNVPAVGATCDPNASNVCATDLVQGDSYAIEAVLYSPSTAYIGDGDEPANPIAPVWGNGAITPAPFTINDTAAANTGGGE